MRVLVCGLKPINKRSKMVNITGSNISNITINGNATNEGTQTNTMLEVDVSVRVQAIQNVLDNLKAIPADWDKFGKGAGPIRNQQMIDEGKPDLVVAFPGGTGTADMVKRAKKHGIEVIEVKNDRN